jgi:hypothetical protein
MRVHVVSRRSAVRLRKLGRSQIGVSGGVIEPCSIYIPPLDGFLFAGSDQYYHYHYRPCHDCLTVNYLFLFMASPSTTPWSGM